MIRILLMCGKAIRMCLNPSLVEVIYDRGSLWFTGPILIYLLFRGFYHVGIRKDRINIVYK